MPCYKSGKFNDDDGLLKGVESIIICWIRIMKIRLLGHILNHILDYMIDLMLDQVLDYIIIGLVAMTLQLSFFLA